MVNRVKQWPRWCLVVTALLVSGALAQAQEASKAVIARRVPDGGIQPQAVVDAAGRLHLLYFKGNAKAGNLYYVRSDDDRAFSTPMRVNHHPDSAIAMGNIRGAQLAVGKGRPHVAWMGSGTAEPRAPHDATPMLYTRLNEDGSAFEPERNIITAAIGLDGGGSLAASDDGQVYVAWHAPPPGGSQREQERAVWVARSRDDGQTFAPEVQAGNEPTGTCGCCGMKAGIDHLGRLVLLYRSANEMVHRDMMLLHANDDGGFTTTLLEPWNVNICPMSSSAFARTAGASLAAWETNGQVAFARLGPDGMVSSPIAPPGKGTGRKHPALAVNEDGKVLLAWTEGMGWNRGGSVAWQVFDRNGKPTAEQGRLPGVPVWSLVAVAARADGGFTILY